MKIDKRVKLSVIEINEMNKMLDNDGEMKLSEQDKGLTRQNNGQGYLAYFGYYNVELIDKDLLPSDEYIWLNKNDAGIVMIGAVEDEGVVLGIVTDRFVLSFSEYEDSDITIEQLKYAVEKEYPDNVLPNKNEFIDFMSKYEMILTGSNISPILKL